MNIDNKYTGNGHKNLDSYFNLIKSEKVTFTAEKAGSLISKYAAGTAWGFQSLLKWKYLINLNVVSVISIIIVGSSLFLYKSEPIFKPSVAVEKKMIESQPVQLNSEAISRPSEKEVVNTSNFLKKNLFASKSSGKIVPSTIYADDAAKDETSNLASENVNEKEKSENISFFKFEPENHGLTSQKENPVFAEPSSYKAMSYEPDINHDWSQTLVNDYSKHNSYSFAVSPHYSRLAGQDVLIVNTRLGWTMNKTITAGLTGSDLTSIYNFNYRDDNNKPFTGQFHYTYGGLYLEYSFNPEKLIHFNVNTTLGLGRLGMIPTDMNSNKIQNPYGVFYVFEPGANVEINLTKFLKIGAEGSYRYSGMFTRTGDFEHENQFKDIQLSGFSGGLFVKVGLF